jgi:hypothetical protein
LPLRGWATIAAEAREARAGDGLEGSVQIQAANHIMFAKDRATGRIVRDSVGPVDLNIFGWNAGANCTAHGGVNDYLTV